MSTLQMGGLSKVVRGLLLTFIGPCRKPHPKFKTQQGAVRSLSLKLAKPGGGWWKQAGDSIILVKRPKSGRVTQSRLWCSWT